eukprot:TRINITY_DN21516_c0_g1_i1.p1 TRINITY_DN21516_c0_g1~~TRINITY_DN21516_c0_g1_i1.p1  ORF type:complete len:411 (+),score=121.74 TRINITY_DN21516_c0_g1_i1:77-1309(+)
MAATVLQTETMDGQVPPEAAAAVADILAADDHYAAIAASRDASEPDLRRAYLQASVKVHPDKNRHPDATRAFQRVSAAWAVLGDPSARARYDEELREKRWMGRGFEDPFVSPDEAFSTFAFATATCAASGGGAGDFAQTLLWAQQLARLRQLQRMHALQQHLAGAGADAAAGGFGSAFGSSFGAGHPGFTGAFGAEIPQPQPPDASVQISQCTGGLALSAGMWAAGWAATAGGWPVVGGFARRIALFQGISQVAIAAQIPAVQDKVKSGASEARVRLGQLGAAAREQWDGAAERAEAAGLLPCLPASRRKGSGGAKARPGRSASGDSAAGGNELVRLGGLESARHLNGLVGEVLGRDPATDRMKVRILPSRGAGGAAAQGGATVKLVWEKNLFPAVETSVEPPASEGSFL